MSQMKLVIFDLDQTLVDFIPLHDETVGRLFKDMFGVEARLTEIDFAGRSLTENFIELGRMKGLPEEMLGKKAGELLARYERLFARSIPRDGRRFVLPGTTELLDGLSGRKHLITLYTGDSPGIVEAVLASTGLRAYFAFWLSGTGFRRRADMVAQAITDAEKRTGGQFRGKDVVVIGDSVRDIECGKEFGALTIAVATGFHPEEELRKREPDHLFRDLRDYRRILEAIG